jgi:hypothetical protein
MSRAGNAGNVSERNPLQLRRVIEERYGVRCTFIRDETVCEPSRDGKVRVFSCTDNPAMLVYAWAEKVDGAERMVIIPAKESIRCARDAVRTHLGGMVG